MQKSKRYEFVPRVDGVSQGAGQNVRESVNGIMLFFIASVPVQQMRQVGRGSHP
jgi:hypothetical protein